MTPAARLAAAIELLDAIGSAHRKPADAIANDFFRSRRFIGSGDRRAVADRVWRVLRAHRRLRWWLARRESVASARLLAAASLLLEGWTMAGLAQAFTGGAFGAAPLSGSERAALAGLEGQRLDSPDMPEAVRLEIADWLLEPLRARFGAALEDELAALAETAPLDLRVNLLKTSRESAAAALAGEGIEATPTPLSPWGLRVATRQAVTGTAAFQSGLVEIQDEGSQLVAALLGARPEMRVADLCAGAGGKTLALAMQMDNRGHLAACDVSAQRLAGAVRRLHRAGVHNVAQHLLVAGDKWAKRRAGGFDRVLVDAPCTGSGTWRRNPYARPRLTPRDLAELLPKQTLLLGQAARLLRVGGQMVYATCSLLPDENEAQIAAFLAQHPGFSLRPLSEVWPFESVPPCVGPYLSLTPRAHSTDGFFAAVLKRDA